MKLNVRTQIWKYVLSIAERERERERDENEEGYKMELE